MFTVSVLDVEKVALIFKEMASCVVLPGEDGEFSVLDFHQAIVSSLGEGVIKIDEKHSIPIKKGIARMEGSEVAILVER